jgi:3-isopropylmalate dehydrogenase
MLRIRRWYNHAGTITTMVPALPPAVSSCSQNKTRKKVSVRIVVLPGDILSDEASELDQAARAIESVIDAVLKDPTTRTADLGGKLGTRAFARHVAALIG